MSTLVNTLAYAWEDEPSEVKHLSRKSNRNQLRFR